MSRSIRWRLVATYVLLTLLTTIVVGVLSLLLVRSSIARQETHYLTANAEAVARRAQRFMEPLPQPLALADLAHTASILTGAQVRILSGDERLLADSGQQERGVPLFWLAPPPDWGTPFIPSSEGGLALFLAPLPEGRFLPGQPLPDDVIIAQLDPAASAWDSRYPFALEVLPAAVPAEAVPTDATQGPSRAVRVPIGAPGAEQGWVELRGTRGFGSEALATTRNALALAGSGALGLAVLVGLVVSRRLTSPLHKLTLATGRMSQGDLSARAPVEGEDEIAQLAHQFNRMAARLEHSFAELAAERDTLRRFIADASHELRTPITALKTFTELLQGAAAQDDAAQREFLAESATQVARLEWITQNLLDLSRLEAGLVQLDLAQQDVVELLQSVAAPFRPLAQERGIALHLDAPATPLGARCDRARLELALSNLLDNALKFTPPGGTVRLGASALPDGIALWVVDSGVGIVPSDQPHLFERFFRGQGVRQPGSGLGLAIVQGIAQAHGGGVQVESAPGEGSRFTMVLPWGGEPPDVVGGDQG